MRTGRGWRVLIARLDGSAPVILDSADLAADDAKLRAHLTTHRVGHTLIMIPASRTIAKACTVPAASDDQLAAALGLQLESLPSGGVPPHRQASAALPPVPGQSGQRQGLLFAWPESTEDEWPELDGAVRFIPETAALAALMHDQRPDDPLLCTHADSGDIALTLAHDGQLRVRGVREGTSSVDRFRESVISVTIETAMHAGMSAEDLDRLRPRLRDMLHPLAADGPSLSLPQPIAATVLRRIEGGRDAQWLHAYGILVGGLLAISGPLAALAQLRDRIETEKPSLAVRTIEYLSRPSTAYRAAVILLLAILLGPLALAWVQLQVLTVRFPDVTEDRRKIDEVRLRLAMYETLGEETWSMTKALGDIATNAPRGMHIEAIRLTTADRTFRIVGIVRNFEDELAPRIVNRMEVNLNNTGMFSSLTPIIGSGDAFGAYQFELSGKFPTPIAPFRPVTYPIDLDYGKYPLVARLQNLPPPTSDEARPSGAVASSSAGDRTSPGSTALVQGAPPTDDGTAAQSAAVRDRTPQPTASRDRATSDAAGEEEEDQTGRELVDRPAFGRDPGAPTAAEGARSMQVDPNLIPEPITEAQIAAMTLAEAQAHASALAAARQRPEVTRDADLSERLQREFNLVFAHMRELRQRSSGSNR